MGTAKQTRRKRSFINLPVLLVLGMGVCGIVTGFVSYKLGDAALEGVTQPETNPTQKLISKSPDTTNDQPTAKFTPVDIAQTAKETRIYIQNQQKRTENKNQPDANAVPPETDDSPEADPEKKP
ncbi:MAG: hypothetical protein VKJ27_10940 [Synechocystis sp.]|nr:hypothetical protein [Synechocystis sp.]